MGLALWSANSLAQALFAALNIAYEEPERRSLFQFYLSAFTFTLLGVLGGDLSCSWQLFTFRFFSLR